MLELSHVSKSFASHLFARGRVQAVEDVSLYVPGGSAFGILRNSGCGKTTLARMMLGLIRPDSGQILLDGEDLSALSGRKLRLVRRKIQLLFQHPESALDPNMKVRDSLMEPLLVHHIGSDGEEREARLRRVLELAYIDRGLLDRYPHQISGGEAQRICVARALLLEPKVLVLDEPTSMLDVSVQAEILSLLQTLRATLRVTCVLISHDLAVLRCFADQLAVMLDGRIVEQAPPEVLFVAPQHPFTRQLVENDRYFQQAWTAGTPRP